MSIENTQHNEVASRAYGLWERAGRPHGRDLEFWVRAEAELRPAAELSREGLGQQKRTTAKSRRASSYADKARQTGVTKQGNDRRHSRVIIGPN